MRQSCRLILSALGGVGVALATIGAGLSSAFAQEATGPYGMQFFVTPYYLWLSGINTAIKTPIPQRPEVDSSVGPFQLLGHLNGVPFFGAFEVRQGRSGSSATCCTSRSAPASPRTMCFSRVAPRS